MANYDVNKVLAIAKAEVGYLEKSRTAYKNNPAVLDQKTEGAGSDNYTKYGRDMHAVYPSVMDFPAAWCDAFVDWCFYKSYGIATAKSLLGGNFDDWTKASAQMYKNKGAWHTSNPQVGDQVFFVNSSGSICHTELIYKVSNGYIYTYGGNTSSAAGVVANGGCVRAKSYAISYSRIAGYGRPKYTNSTVVAESDDAKLKRLYSDLQKAFNEEYNAGITTGGVPGPKTLAATPTLNKGIRGKKPKTVKAFQALLTFFGYKCSVDGDFYTATEKQVKAFQKEVCKQNNPDGEFTSQKTSWKKLLKVQ